MLNGFDRLICAVKEAQLSMLRHFANLPKAEQRKQAEKLRKAIRRNRVPKFKPEK